MAVGVRSYLVILKAMSKLFSVVVYSPSGYLIGSNLNQIPGLLGAATPNQGPPKRRPDHKIYQQNHRSSCYMMSLASLTT